MEWFQVLVIIMAVMGMFLYLANKIDKIGSTIQEEMKDFHGRLCSLEERRK